MRRFVEFASSLNGGISTIYGLASLTLSHGFFVNPHLRVYRMFTGVSGVSLAVGDSLGVHVVLAELAVESLVNQGVDALRDTHDGG